MVASPFGLILTMGRAVEKRSVANAGPGSAAHACVHHPLEVRSPTPPRVALLLPPGLARLLDGVRNAATVRIAFVGRSRLAHARAVAGGEKCRTIEVRRLRRRNEAGRHYSPDEAEEDRLVKEINREAMPASESDRT